MTYLFDDTDDTQQPARNGDEPMVEAGEYDLGDDIGERIGKDDSSDNSAL